MEQPPAPASSPSPPAVSRVVQAWSEIPAFEDEEAEAAFWAETQIDARLMTRDIHKAITPETAAVVLKMDARMLARIRRLARGRYLDHHAMILQWLAERLEKES